MARMYCCSVQNYGNGAPIGQIEQGTSFHGSPPGNTRLRHSPSEPLLGNTNLQLVSGTQAYVQIQWEATGKRTVQEGKRLCAETPLWGPVHTR